MGRISSFFHLCRDFHFRPLNSDTLMEFRTLRLLSFLSCLYLLPSRSVCVSAWVLGQFLPFLVISLWLSLTCFLHCFLAEVAMALITSIRYFIASSFSLDLFLCQSSVCLFSSYSTIMVTMAYSVFLRFITIVHFEFDSNFITQYWILRHVFSTMWRSGFIK